MANEDDDGKDWDDMNTSEKLEALGVKSPEEAIELCQELLDTVNQIEDLVKADEVTVPLAKLRPMLLKFFPDE